MPRVAVFWFGSFAFMQHAFVAFTKTFPNLVSYGSFSNHPNYKLLGPLYSYFYLIRPIFWTYIFARMTRYLVQMVQKHWYGKDDLHYFWYYDTLYPDMFFDEEDMRYINFRYTDNKVAPDPLIGYYPYDNLKYGKFLNQKDNNFGPRQPTYLE